MATALGTSRCTLISQCSLKRSTLAFASSGVRSTFVAAPGFAHRGAVQPARQQRLVTRAEPERTPGVKYNTEFGYSRKDVLLICGGLIAFGYALYYGLQATGMEAGYAGNWVQLIIFMGICVGWVSTYIFRVATKQMTYVKQLEAYEEAVMKKRVEEMTEAEMSELAAEVEAERQRKQRGGQ